MMRASAHYGLAVIVLAVYGIQVCPFLDSLSPAELGGPVLAIMTLQFLARPHLGTVLVSPLPVPLRARRLLVLEFALFLASGAILAAFNTLHHAFPVESGLKIICGFATLGFFAAVDLALELEHLLALRFQREGKPLEPGPEIFPVSRKLKVFAAASVCIITAVLFLVVNKDLEWLGTVGRELPLGEARQAILWEFAFVAGVILAHAFNVIRSYSRNLAFFFDAENRVLARTNQGDFAGRVPVSTNDEFAVMAHQTNLMVEAIRARTEEVQRTQDVTILGLATLAETRDNETGAHILRTQRYVRALALHLRQDPRFSGALDEATIDLLYKSAPLHDVGKVGIPDAILLKPGKLDDDEFKIMKTHATLGAEAIRVAERELGEGGSFLRFAREIAATHHEKWDGSGYPAGLAGTAIPLSGRLMAVADVYDALISKRVYKPPFPHEKARAIILEGRGTHFDPEVVDAFLAVEEDFKAIAAGFADEAYGSHGGDDSPRAASRAP